MDQSLPVLRTDRSDRRAKLRGTHIDGLQATSQHSPLLQLDHELECIAALHEQAALNPDTGLADIQNLARRRESPPLQTAPRLTSIRDPFRLNPIGVGLLLSTA